jgi:hypothetical protein
MAIVFFCRCGDTIEARTAARLAEEHYRSARETSDIWNPSAWYVGCASLITWNRVLLEKLVVTKLLEISPGFMKAEK